MAWVQPLEDPSDQQVTSIDNIPIHDLTNLRPNRHLQTNLSVVPESAHEPESLTNLPKINEDPDIDIGEDSENENMIEQNEIEDISKDFIHKLAFDRDELLRRHYGINQTDESMLKEVLEHFKVKKHEEEKSRMLSEIQTFKTFGAKPSTLKKLNVSLEKNQLSARCSDFYKPKHHSKRSTNLRLSLPNPPTIVLNLSINSTKASKMTPSNYPNLKMKSKKNLDKPENSALASRTSNLYVTLPQEHQEHLAQKQLSDQLIKVSNKIESLIKEVSLIREHFRQKNISRKGSFMSQLSIIEDTLREKTDTGLWRYRDTRANKENSGFLN